MLLARVQVGMRQDLRLILGRLVSKEFEKMWLEFGAEKLTEFTGRYPQVWQSIRNEQISRMETFVGGKGDVGGLRQ
jgi:hypothetical protein